MRNIMWFFHFLKNALSQRKGRVLVASASIAIASATIVGGMGLSLGIRLKLGEELKAYGANIMILPSGGEEYLRSASVEGLSRINGVEQYTGQLYGMASMDGHAVELIGLDLKRDKSWKIEGRLPSSGEVMLGSDIAAAYGTKAGNNVLVGFMQGEAAMQVSGVVQSGGPEDRALIMGLKEAQALGGLQGQLSAVFARGDTVTLKETIREIRALLAGAEVKTLRQVVFAEESFLRKIELLMLLVTLVVVLASGISVSSTMAATVLERLREIGLMKAMGGSAREIGMFYLMEAAAIGVMGGAIGYCIGFLSAQAVSHAAFGSYVAMPYYLVLIALGAGLAIAVSSSAMPLAAALKQRPSVIMRGE